MRTTFLTVALALAVSSVAHADPLTCNLTNYKASPGLAAARRRQHAERDVGRRQQL